MGGGKSCGDAGHGQVSLERVGVVCMDTVLARRCYIGTARGVGYVLSPPPGAQLLQMAGPPRRSYFFRRWLCWGWQAIYYAAPIGMPGMNLPGYGVGVRFIEVRWNALPQA